MSRTDVHCRGDRDEISASTPIFRLDADPTLFAAPFINYKSDNSDVARLVWASRSSHMTLFLGTDDLYRKINKSVISSGNKKHIQIN